MVLEKTELANHIYPVIKEYCKQVQNSAKPYSYSQIIFRDKYGIEFQVIDMRWGGRDESTDDHMTTNICLEELEHCKHVSVGPFFFFLMGQKYGYRPLPNMIVSDQFEHMLQAINKILSASRSHSFLGIRIFEYARWCKSSKEMVYQRSEQCSTQLCSPSHQSSSAKLLQLEATNSSVRRPRSLV